jgi:hypothetical protein
MGEEFLHHSYSICTLHRIGIKTLQGLKQVGTFKFVPQDISDGKTHEKTPAFGWSPSWYEEEGWTRQYWALE